MNNNEPRQAVSPLLSWDIFTEWYQQQITNAQLVREDLKAIRLFSRQYKWREAFEYQPWLAPARQAVIITDPGQTILWVSLNFESMTGYKRTEALDKRPSFLQGPKTDREKLSFISRRLRESPEPLTETLLNYKKNGEEYLCEINIHPLHNRSGNLVNFIAFERELVPPVNQP